MNITLINPFTHLELTEVDDRLKDSSGQEFKLINGAYRIVEDDNYTQSFGYQWNKFTQTQTDHLSSLNQSKGRLFAVTQWDKENLENKDVLEVGSGAGRFSQVILDYTKANLFSVDYSNAVEANFRNNGHHKRLKLFQASIYELPFAKRSFDKVFCFGVLQHTPDFKMSINCLAEMVKPGGELVVDFYPVKGWWTKIHSKYLFRPVTKRLSHKRLLKLISANISWLILAYQIFDKLKVGKMVNRFLPICDINNTLPKGLPKQKMKEWVILDTFDMFSPEHDHPQRINTVKKWMEEAGLMVEFAGFVNFEGTNTVAAVKGRRV